MLQFFLSGGVFMPVILLSGLVTLFMNFRQLKQKKSHQMGIIVGLIVATLLLGLLGTGVGFYSASSAFGKVAVAKHASLLGRIIGIAMTTLTFAAFWSAINAILCGIVHTKATSN